MKTKKIALLFSLAFYGTSSFAQNEWNSINNATTAMYRNGFVAIGTGAAVAGYPFVVKNPTAATGTKVLFGSTTPITSVSTNTGLLELQSSGTNSSSIFAQYSHISGANYNSIMLASFPTITNPYAGILLGKSGTNSTIPFKIFTGAVDAISIWHIPLVTPTAYMGVGTINNTPLEKLHVHDGALRLTGTSLQGGPMVLFGGGFSSVVNGEWGIEYTTSGTPGLNFWKPFGSTGTSGNNFLFLNNSGRVGINTNNVTAQLTVNGNVLIGDPAVVCIPNTNYKLFVQTGILTEKVKVAVNCSGNWADYVFDAQYKLKSLNEVEMYVKANKHLPGIPSAEEVVADGIDLGQMDAKLLEKIEELTLYLIEQDKKIETLQKELIKLQQK